MAWDRTNGPFVRNSIVLTATSGAPVFSGQVALWNQSGVMQCRTPGGQDLAFGGDIFSVPVDLASCTSGQIPVRQFARFNGAVTGFDWQTTKPPTTSGRSTVIQLGIGSGSASGGVINLHYSGMATLGTRVQGTAITGANTFTTSGEITATVTSVGASGAMADGQGVLTIFVAPTA